MTGVAGRFSTRDLLESIIVPSKTISDQYESVTVATADGRVITGRIVNLNGDNLMINPDMLDPNNMVNVPRSQIEEIKQSPVSMMPVGLLEQLAQRRDPRPDGLPPFARRPPEPNVRPR